MNASKVKPSQAHGNPEILRAMADEANRKRAQRKAEQAKAEEPKAEEPKAEQPKAEQPKARKFGKVIRVIRVKANGIEYATLTEFVLTLPNCGKVDGKHSTYAISVWNKLNAKLKKQGWVEVNGIILTAI